MARHAGKLMLAGIGVVVLLLALGGPAERQTAEPAARPAAPPAPRKLVGRTTQNVLRLEQAIADGGVVLEPGGDPDEGGIAAYGQAYRRSMARIGGLAVEQKMNIYRAEHATLPATHAEFMATIIAPGTADEVRLPALPHEQEYAFDPATKRLVVVEFPARKAAP